MADDVSADLRIGLDATPLSQGLKKTTAEAKKEGKEIEKAFEGAKGQVDQLGQSLEKAGQKAKATLTPNAMAANQRNKSWAETMGTPEQRAKLFREQEEQKRLTSFVRASLRQDRLNRPLSIQQYGKLQSAALLMDDQRTQQYGRMQSSALLMDDARTQKMGRTQSLALKMDSELAQRMGKAHSLALKIEDDRIQKLGKAQSQALKIEDDRVQRMGKTHSLALKMDDDLTQKMGKAQSLALKIEDDRIQRLGKTQSLAIKMEDDRVQRMGRIQAQAIRMNEKFDADRAKAAAGGGGGGWRGLFGNVLGIGGAGGAGRLLASTLTGLGIGVGGVALTRAVQGTFNAAQQATAYERQELAARTLAGSQEKLNAILQAYDKASGGAISKSTQLANVTRLLATGFAKSAEEVERFVGATRGASIALGKPEDYVIQETQLAISNTSQKRLDQIGLGIKEVNDRIEELRDTNKGWTREMAFQEAILVLMEEKYGNLAKSAEGQATAIERLNKAWDDLFLNFGQNAGPATNAVARFLTKLITAPNVSEDERQARASRRDKLYSTDIFPINTSLFELWGGLTGRSGTQIRAQHALDSGMIPNVPDFSGRYDRKPLAPVSKGYSEEQQSVIDSYFDQFDALEKNYQKQRLDATRQYEEQRTNLIRDFGKTMAREEEDFQRSRARSLRDYERSIMDVMRDAQERDSEMAEDYADRVAEMQEDSGKRLADMQEEYNERREEAEKEHRDNLMKAAGQLDAIAVLEERKRWAKQQKEQEKQFDKSVTKEKESLQERIDDAQKAYEEQLDDARKADAKRLEDMRVNRERQLADEDEDRKIRLQRAQEDHDEQLAELDRQHALRLEQIATQAEEERAELQKGFELALDEANVYLKGLDEKIKARDARIEAWFEGVATRMEALFGIQVDENRYKFDPTTGPQIPTDYSKALVGTSSVSSAKISAGSMVNSKSVVIEEGAISIIVSDGGTGGSMRDMMREVIVDVMENY